MAAAPSSAAVGPVDCESLDSEGNIEDGGLIERDEVGKARHEADPAAVLNNGARRQLSSPRTSRSLCAKASGWPAYPDSPPRKPPWWLGNTIGCCPRSSAAAADVRAVTVPADSSPTAMT